MNIMYHSQQISNLPYNNTCNIKTKIFPFLQSANILVLPNALPRQLAVVAMVTGSTVATLLAGVDLRSEVGSMKTRLEPPAKRTPAPRAASRERIAHCMFCGAKLLR